MLLITAMPMLYAVSIEPGMVFTTTLRANIATAPAGFF
jgi:hypothetical protein|tara:strand:- start:1082 stop:1195 length:114 start_codon:yes stop_codon:yes gene_type:complete